MINFYNEVIGIFFLLLGVIHGVWTIAAFIRAKKSQWPLRWPISGQWVLTFYSLSLTLVALDIFRIRIFEADGSTGFVFFVRGFAVIMSIWAMWRWLSGNLLNARDEFR